MTATTRSKTLSNKISKKDRIQRKYKCCTGCGEELPRNRPNWGLVWNDKDHGMCKRCLYEIRKAIGVYKKNPELEKEDKPKNYKGA